MERPIDAAYFQRLFLPKPLALITAVVLASPLLFATELRADDTVLVVPTGPTMNAQVFGLNEANGEPASVDFGHYPLLDSTMGQAPIRDLKVLPDGRNLLSDVAGRGVAITDALGASEFSLDAPGARLRITSASVSAYAAPGEIARLLITDSNRSQAFVVDPRNPSGRLNWARGFALPGSRASFVDAIVLPGQKAALGITWATLGVSAIDVFSTSSGSPQTVIRRLASTTHPNQPEEFVIIPELDQLRAFMGLANGNLLVTTQYSLFEMDLEGDIKWKITLGQGAVDANGEAMTLRGEFTDATLLPSGRIALTTAQPGVWTSPHVNHRVYWLSPSALANSEIEVIARSPALEFAPYRIEPRDGHGASGSFGFMPGLDATESGPLSDLTLSREFRLNQSEFVSGDNIFASADIGNPSAAPIALSSLIILANAGACGAQTETSIALVEAVAVEIAPGEVFALRGSRTVDAAFSPGRWCARIYAQNGQGERVELGSAIEFDILEPSGNSGSTIDVEDLDFWKGSENGENPDDETPTDFPSDDDDLGCGCASASGASPERLPAAALMLLGFGGLGWVRRRRAARR
ncbi:MYXO-CTERM domain-containing protein [Bradymonas sediminis]|nr:MYXO-CTERM domain-containing protein [Bradymonas sediminis]